MNPSRKCFAHFHLTIAEFGLWTHLRELSYGSKPQHTYRFDDRAIAARFAEERGCSKDTINRLRRSLADKKFIAWLEPQKRIGGRFAPRLGRILDHAEWAEKYPGRCIHNALEGDKPPVSNKEFHQSQVADHQSHSKAHQSQTKPSPVSNKASHQSQQRDISLITQSDNTTPSLSRMASAQKFSESTSSPLDSANRETHSEAPVSAARQVDSSPVSPARQVDSSPVSPTRQVTAEEITIAGRFGLVMRNGEWFTGEGTKLNPKAVEVLLGKEGQL